MSVMSRILPNERTRHVVIAAVIAFVMAAGTLLSPLDRLIWLIESRLSETPVSGDIVLVSSDDDLADPESPGRRKSLANVIRSLDDAGAKRIYVDFVFDKPSSAEADAELAAAIAKMGDRIALITEARAMPGGGEKDTYAATIGAIAGNAENVVNRRFVDYSGYTWHMPYAEEHDDKILATLPASIAQRTGSPDQVFLVDYNFDPSEIRTIAFRDLTGNSLGNTSSELSGKTVIVSWDSPASNDNVAIPGYLEAPKAFVQIFAAETLMQGNVGPLNRYGEILSLLAAFVSALFLVARFAHGNMTRRLGYMAVAIGPAAFLFYCTQFAKAPYLAHALGFLAIYGIARVWARRKKSQLHFDEAIGLPTFLALERDLTKTGNVRSVSVVVAKLHRFDEVTSALSDQAIAEYVQQIANRFRIAEQDLQVYTKGGKYLAWITETADREMLESHLRGLRAVFAHPLVVKDLPVDVGITFAADMTAEDNAARKIASANSTLEKTTEAHEPVLFAEMASEGDRWWNISLQAKIDEALEQGHIYVVFQPKLNVRQGTVVGAEALVRWKDPERGNIAPNYFVEQCENAGRMDHLTRHVLRKALLAAKEFAVVNAQFTISVNISATMLRDYRVAEMVEEIVEKTGFNPRNLVLEITETSRIADYDIAYDVMSRLRLHGIKLSIDDFGVGSASMETLLRLPFDELKIDRAFIARMHDDQKARAISQMMIAFGKQTRITVVAEGVEDESNMRVLRELGCEILQGYYISKPLMKNNFLQFQTDNQRGLAKRALSG